MAAANIYDLERLAYDVFVRTLSKFEIKTNLPSSRRGENTYEHSNFLDIICNGILLIQIVMRKKTWPTFQAQFDLHGFKKFHQISDFLDGELKKLSMKDTENETVRATVSLAFINELIQFLYSKNSRLHLLSLAASWGNYVSSFREKFDAEGGFSSFYSKKLEQYESAKPIVDEFIQLHSFQYEEEIVTKFFEKFGDPKIKKELTRMERCASEFLPRTAKTPKRSENRQTEASSSLENTGLGIPPHEELLKNLNVLSLDEAASKRSMSSSVDEVAVASGLNRSPIGPADRLKEPGSSTSSPLSPAGRSKDGCSLTGSPVSPAERLKDLDDSSRSPISPAERSQDLGGLPRSPRSPAERSKKPGFTTTSPANPQGQSPCRSSQTPERSKDRLEQKRKKLLQRKKTEPTV